MQALIHLLYTAVLSFVFICRFTHFLNITIRDPPVGNEVAEGSDVIIDCIASKSRKSEIRIQWYKGGKSLSNNQHHYNVSMQIRKDGLVILRLTISPVLWFLNNTVYSCVVTPLQSPDDSRRKVHWTLNVKYSRITNSSKVVHGSRDQPHILRCPIDTSSSIHSIKISWTFQNQSGVYTIKPSTRSTVLSLRALTDNQSGKYVCEARFANESRKHEQYLALTDKPLLSMKGLNVTIARRSQAQLICVVRNKVLLRSLRWEKDGERIALQKPSAGMVRFILNLNKVVKENITGLYKCIAENEHGRSTARAQVIFEGVPSIKISTPETFREGRPANLTCVAVALPPVTEYMWKKDNTILSYTEPVLRFLNITPLDDGQYTCIAWNTVGKASATRRVNVSHRPIVRVRSLQVKQGDSAMLRCEVNSRPQHTKVQWTKGNDTPFAETSLVFNITSVRMADDGEYICVVNNSIGVGESRAKLTVIPRVFVDYPSPISVRQGTDASIRCSLRDTLYNSLVWLFKDTVVAYNNTILSSQHDYAINYTSTPSVSVLTLLRINFIRGGTYSCVHRKKEIHAKVTVIDMAKKPIIIKPSVYLLRENHHVMFRCNSSGGYPHPTFTWYKGGALLIAQTGVTIFSAEHPTQIGGTSISKLIIKLKSTDNDMNLKCVVTQAIKNWTSSTSDVIPVRYKPIILPMKEQLIFGGDRIELRCVFHSNPKGHLSGWYLDGKKLGLQQKPVLKIFAAKETDSGIYQCIVQNELGSTSSFVTVNVAETKNGIPRETNPGENPAHVVLLGIGIVILLISLSILIFFTYYNKRVKQFFYFRRSVYMFGQGTDTSSWRSANTVTSAKSIQTKQSRQPSTKGPSQPRVSSRYHSALQSQSESLDTAPSSQSVMSKISEATSFPTKSEVSEMIKSKTPKSTRKRSTSH